MLGREVAGIRKKFLRASSFGEKNGVEQIVHVFLSADRINYIALIKR